MQRLACILLAGATLAFGQATPRSSDQDQNRSARSAENTRQAGVTYGTIKEFTAGQKVVIDVKNAMDKRFDLTDKDVTVNIDKNLKVGDPVMVSETKSSVGKTTAVTISKHAGGDSNRR